jgi:hypothetical protein
MPAADPRGVLHYAWISTVAVGTIHDCPSIAPFLFFPAERNGQPFIRVCPSTQIECRSPNDLKAHPKGSSPFFSGEVFFVCSCRSTK